MRWAILGTGAISARFAAGLRFVPGARATLVASREQASAQRFATAHGIPTAVAGYDASAIAAAADIAYIATPTGLHAAHAIACLEAGCHVLVEKPLAATHAEAVGIAETARARGLFAMEGLWTRFLPATHALKEEAERLGGALVLHGHFAFANAPEPDRPVFRPDLGGGALGQYGVYPLALAQFLAGPAESLHATGRLAETGVDASVALSLGYRSGAIGSFFCSLETSSDTGFSAHCRSGRVALTGPIYRPAGIRVAHVAPRRAEAAGGGGGLKARLRNAAPADRLVQALQHRKGPAGRARAIPHTGNGYNLEAAEAEARIAAGATESPLMPLADSLELAALLDQARAQVHSR
ncbi:MAG: Gfo/Idh/MocA family oxidoreductase [Sphingomonadaceae bacterium]